MYKRLSIQMLEYRLTNLNTKIIFSVVMNIPSILVDHSIRRQILKPPMGALAVFERKGWVSAPMWTKQDAQEDYHPQHQMFSLFLHW